MDLKKLGYDFSSQYFNIDGHNLHYIDEGAGEVIVMLHGNPTWSFYYRNLIQHFSKTHRVIVPDHMGCGLSDKPQDYNYSLNRRVSDVEKLLRFLGVERFKLIVHDWGGAIGFGLATLTDMKADKIVITNTAAFTSDYIPWQINIVKKKPLGPFLVKYFNGFCWPATFMTTVKKLPRFVKQAYLMPYKKISDRVAINQFVQDIPMSKEHKSYKTLKEIEHRLKDLDSEKLILWGKKDFCFNDYFLNRWKGIYPESRIVEYEDAGHYLFEDKSAGTIGEIERFFVS